MHPRLVHAVIPGLVALFGVTALAGCTGEAPSAKSAATAVPSPHYVGSMSLQPKTGVAGTVVHVTGQGLPPNQAVDVTWQQVTGAWKMTDGEFGGSTYTEKYVPLASATTDSTGSVSASFKVPAGFGYAHNVRLTHAGQAWNQASFKIPVVATITPSSGPVGTPISITLTGIGFKTYYQNYVLAYDNVMTGWLSAVTTEGTAHATILAAGLPGRHYLTFTSAGDRVPYLNNQQSPVEHVTDVSMTRPFVFTVTNGPAILPPTPEAQSPEPVDAVRPVAATTGPQVWLNRASGPPGTPLVLQGSGFPAGQAVEIDWQTVKGNRSVSGYGDVTNTLKTLEADPGTGAFQFAFPAPVDLFGDHKITVVSGAKSASTSFSISPKALPLKVSSGPVGTDIVVHLVGTGYTLTANIYTLVYDNAYIGFACGFNSQGDITVHIPATGQPGWHLIALYPSIWKLPDIAPGGSDYIQMPQLTYADDHPGEHLPAFTYGFYVTT
jgi:hypothetical protein